MYCTYCTYLADKSLRSIQGRHKGVHQHVEVGEERAESDRDCQAELNEEVLHVLLVDPALQPIEALEEVGEEREELLVQQLVTPCGEDRDRGTCEMNDV